MSNQRQVALAVQMYAQDHNETLPIASTTLWGTDLGISSAVLKCPDATVTNGYAYNSMVSGMALGTFSAPEKQAVTFDGETNTKTQGITNPVPNVAYSTNDILARHTNRYIASFLDGHVELAKTSLSANPTLLYGGVVEPMQFSDLQLAYTYDDPSSIGLGVAVASAPSSSWNGTDDGNHWNAIATIKTTWTGDSGYGFHCADGATSFLLTPKNKAVGAHGISLYQNGPVVTGLLSCQDLTHGWDYYGPEWPDWANGDTGSRAAFGDYIQIIRVNNIWKVNVIGKTVRVYATHTGGEELQLTSSVRIPGMRLFIDGVVIKGSLPGM